MIEFQRANEHTAEEHVEGFVEAYKEAFGGPPYGESYTTDEVIDDVWTPHLQDGVTFLAIDSSKVVGFGCATPVTKAEHDVQKYLSEHATSFDFDTEKAWYMSELGVLESHRRQRIGISLVKHRLEAITAIGDTDYVFRTAAEGSNSIDLYKNIGATVLPELQSVADSDQVKVNGSRSVARVYLYGDCESALKKIESALKKIPE